MEANTATGRREKPKPLILFTTSQQKGDPHLVSTANSLLSIQSAAVADAENSVRKINTCGLVTDGMEGVNYTHLYTCGPEAMLHAVWQRCRTDGQFSFEERMGCGFGACMGCTCRTKYGHKRICKDGPVLRREEIVW